jgi:Cu2+-exporting ATPase
VGAGTLTFLAWLLLGFDLNFAITRTVTVLVMACPHALGLAIPLVVVNATSMSAKNVILVRNREAFERARDLKIIAFDKTGTLTEGRFGVRAIYSAGLSKEEALCLAAALEARSEHPLAKAVVEEAEQRGLEVPSVSDFKVAAGVAYSWGLLLSPAVGAVLMSASTVIVAINAVLLRRASLA